MGINATPQFIGALTEMVWTQIGMSMPCLCWRRRNCVNSRSDHRLTNSPIETVSQDLESFAK